MPPDQPGTPRAPGRHYRSDLRAERARQTRGRILAAARESFARRGYAGSTVRLIAAAAGVSVPTVELAFGTKTALLKAVIDVAIAGDDEQVPVLERDWTRTVRAARSPQQVLAATVDVLGPAQQRSAALVMAVLEGAAGDGELATLGAQLIAQREITAGWIVDAVAATGPLRPGPDRQDAVDTVWLLMDPALFVRLTRDRGWSVGRYQAWIARSLQNLLVPDPAITRTDPEEIR